MPSKPPPIFPAEQQLLAALGAWDLKALVPYDDRYLSGFRAESYTIDLPHGFESARVVMIEGIKVTIRRDIARAVVAVAWRAAAHRRPDSES